MYCSKHFNFALANRPLQKPIFWQSGGLAAIEVFPSAKRQPVQRHPDLVSKKPEAELGSEFPEC